MKKLIGVLSVAASTFTFSGDLLAAQDSTAKTTIENNTRDLRSCYRNALNGVTRGDPLRPCDRALEKEGITRRQRAVTYGNRGVIQFNIGDYEAAAADFTASLDHGIHVIAKMHVNRGLCYEALGMDALARQDYRAALVVNEDHPVALRRLEELSKPLYERSRLPRRITTELPARDATGI